MPDLQARLDDWMARFPHAKIEFRSLGPERMCRIQDGDGNSFFGHARTLPLALDEAIHIFESQLVLS